MANTRGFRRLAGKMAQFQEADRLLRHAAQHLGRDSQALPIIADAMLKLPILRTTEQATSLEALRAKAESTPKPSPALPREETK